MKAPAELHELVQRFAEHQEQYQTGRYNETQLRRDYLDPFLRFLGWDVDNRLGHAEAYREVVHEDFVKVAGRSKSPDYSCRIGGNRKFFVEAKKPSVHIRNEPGPAFQLRRYAWSAKLPLSILTDFGELAVYDCRIRPSKDDRASVARIKYWTFDTYIDEWEEIYGIFSKEAVLKGSFDKFAIYAKGKRGTTQVDDAFLDEIEEWRETLAQDLALNNQDLSQRDLNWAVQQTIDRIVFLRIAEDRGLEPYGRLRALRDGGDIYARLVELFIAADERYNSGLFHFKKEKERAELHDQLSLRLRISDKALREILKNLYYPESPYEFSVLGADILGSVYERFLGKVIRLTAGHHAKIEEKPELKKAGGIYYTPTFVVGYIVKAAIGPFLSGKSPREVSNLRVLDPACGSGSFLLGAYQYLLDWHRDWYIEDGTAKHSRGRDPKLHQGRGGSWRLTTRERKRILLTNIFGVDIDAQAVEVTKLSLLLKVLEGETQLELFNERILPDLHENIRCGNSLIGSEYYSGSLLEPDDETVHRVNPFDWDHAFPGVVNRGGFDVVIGNPPYRRELDYKELMEEIASTSLGRLYRSARMDLWYYFVHRALQLLKPGGTLAYIVNAYWTAGTGAEKLISQLRNSAHIDEIFLLGKLKVFENVSGQHMIIKISNAQSSQPTLLRFPIIDNETSAEPFIEGRREVSEVERPKDSLFRDGKIDVHEAEGEYLDVLAGLPELGTLGRVRQGIAENPAAINKKTNEKFGGKWRTGAGVFVLKSAELRTLKLTDADKALIRPYHELCDLGRYFLADNPSSHLIYSTKTTCPDIKLCKGIHDHLIPYKPIMVERRETANGSNQWWHLHWPRDEEIWRSAKILSIQMAARPAFVPAEVPTYVPFSVNVFVPDPSVREHLNYFAAVLNSRLMWEWFKHHAKRRGVGLEINGNVLQRAPVRRIDFSLPRETLLHDKIVSLVSRILDVQQKMRLPKSPQEGERLSRLALVLDDEIDVAIYQLYGISDSQAMRLKGDD